jgi:3-oxoadipate enol-lactonase
MPSTGYGPGSEAACSAAYPHPAGSGRWRACHATMCAVELAIPVPGGEVRGEDTGGDGAPLVLMHPGWGDSAIWDPVLTRLTSRYRVIRYDARGYGRSPKPAAAFSQLADLAAVLDHLGVDRAAVAGHSGGGGPALGLALDQPERVTALILVAPGVQDYPWPADDPYFTEFGALYEAGDRDGLIALGLRTWAVAGSDPAARAQIGSAVAAFFAQGSWERPDPPVYGRLGEVRVPAVLTIGDLDYPLMRDCGERIAGRIPGCRTVLVPGADHLLPLRAPDRLADLITEYVR